MTPGAIIALIKDGVIVISIAAVAYFLINYGKDVVKVSDIKAVQKQLIENTATVAQWQKESIDADTKHIATLAKIADTINAQHTPVFVRGSSCANPVSGNAAKTSSQPSAAGTTDPRGGVDYRPVINRFELKYETALADCYTALDKWPQ